MPASEIKLSFIHKFVPAKSGNSVTLLLLHGTGGDEDDLIPLATELSNGSAILSPRGKVLENGMPRFFRRPAEGVFDVEDLKYRTNELAEFVRAASFHYGFELSFVVAIGFSNGANIAASLLLLRPEVLRGTILFRPIVPLVPEKRPDLSGKRIYVSAGSADPIIAREETENLVNMLREYRAEVVLSWPKAGHSLVEQELDEVKTWFVRAFL